VSEQEIVEGYWLATNAAESKRLLVQHRYFTQALGGLLPRSIPVRQVHKILDVGCGPGGWALDLTRKYSHISVTGIDNSCIAITDATRVAQMNGVHSVTFEQMDATKPLRFANGSFDLVHMRSASPFIQPAMWPQVITELVRVLRPGGWLVLVDYEQGPTSSAAFNRISMLSMQAVRAAKLSLAPHSLTIGAAVRLYSFLLNAYLFDVSYTIHGVDFGSGNNVDAPMFIDELLAGAANIKPFLTRLGLIESEQDFDALIEKVREELTQPDACGYAYLIAATGRKDG